MEENDLLSARSLVLDTLFRTIQSYTAISNLAHVSSVEPHILLPIFQSRSEPVFELLSSTKADNDRFSELLIGVKEQADALATHNTQNAINAACLVFSHSLADGAVETFCKIASDFDPPYWHKIVSKQAFNLGTLAKHGAHNLMTTSIKRKIETMGLPRKMKHLIGNAGSHSNVSIPHFSYDKTRLTALDTIRHEIVHKSGIAAQVGDRDSPEFFYYLTIYAGLIISSMLGSKLTHKDVIAVWLARIRLASLATQ